LRDGTQSSLSVRCHLCLDKQSNRLHSWLWHKLASNLASACRYVSSK